jgi:nitrogen fixation NifU-like protein
MADARALYQEVILDHNRKPRNFGELEGATHRAEGHNPLCGDRIQVSLALAGEHIDGLAFRGEACAICKASASMMTQAVKGKTRAEADTLVQEFRDMATGRLDPAAEHHLGRLAVFAGVRDLPTRVKCAVLPWHTLHAAISSASSEVPRISTEAQDDPIPGSGIGG